MDQLWLIVMILLIVVEFISTNVVTIFYAISALCALILSSFINNYIIESSVFVVLGTILLIIFRPIINTKFKKILRKVKRVK